VIIQNRGAVARVFADDRPRSLTQVSCRYRRNCSTASVWLHCRL